MPYWVIASVFGILELAAMWGIYSSLVTGVTIGETSTYNVDDNPIGLRCRGDGEVFRPVLFSRNGFARAWVLGRGSDGVASAHVPVLAQDPSLLAVLSSLGPPGLALRPFHFSSCSFRASCSTCHSATPLSTSTYSLHG